MSRPVHALGVDVSTTATALVVLGPDGHQDHALLQHNTGEQGPRRLMLIRQAVVGELFARQWRVDVAAVECPRTIYRGRNGVRTTSFALESAAAIVMEAVQAWRAGMIVLDPTPTQWQAQTIGTGQRLEVKARSVEHARAHGLDTRDDNLADALCIGEYARDRYLRDVVGVVA